MEKLCGWIGENPPQRPHHRTAHSSWVDTADEPDYHRHILYGALVGGPDQNDKYVDSVADYVQNEVACDYNAGFVGALAKMYDVYGGDPIPGFTAIEEVPYPEIFISASLSDRTTATEVAAFAVNKSGWPARVIDDLSFKYFVDLTDYINGGFSPDQISSKIIYSAASTATVSGPYEYDTSKNIYYFEIDLSGTAIFPGSRSDHQKEVQFHIIPPNGAPWNSTKDYSYLVLEKGNWLKFLCTATECLFMVRSQMEPLQNLPLHHQLLLLQHHQLKNSLMVI